MLPNWRRICTGCGWLARRLRSGQRSRARGALAPNGAHAATRSRRRNCAAIGLGRLRSSARRIFRAHAGRQFAPTNDVIGTRGLVRVVGAPEVVESKLELEFQFGFKFSKIPRGTPSLRFIYLINFCVRPRASHGPGAIYTWLSFVDAACSLPRPPGDQLSCVIAFRWPLQKKHKHTPASISQNSIILRKLHA